MRGLARGGFRLIVECCALYLLSVLCLLGGVYSAMGSPLFGGAGVAGDLPLWGVMQGYDLALLGVIGFLFARPERREDGYWVAMAAVALTLDPTLFNNRFYTYDLGYGLGMNSLGLVLALAKVSVLAWVCRLPMGRGAVASLAAALGVVYLGGAPLNLASFAPYAPTYYAALCWIPLVMAFLVPAEGIRAEDLVGLTAKARIRAREFRWVAMVLPFAGVALHLWQMPQVYDLAAGPAHWAAWPLALLVLVARFLPDQVEQTVWLLGTLSGVSLGMTLLGPETFHHSAWAQSLTPLRLQLLAQVLVASYLALRFRMKVFEVPALALASLFLAGGTPGEIAANYTGAYGWTWFTVVAWIRFRRSPGFDTVVPAWFGISGLAGCLVTGEPLSATSCHLAGVGLVVFTHLYEGYDEKYPELATLVIYLLLAHAGWSAWSTGTTAAWARLGLECGGMVLGAALTPFLRYRVGVLAGGALLALRSPLVPWLRAHSAGMGLTMAFAFLGGGLWVSTHKADLLTRLEEPST